jgi:hypothetical protein
MLETLANDPWPMFGVLFAAACLAVWWSRRTASKPAFLVGLLLLAASLLPLLAGLLVDTPYKQVDKFVHELADAGQKRDHRKLADALDPEYNHAGFTKEKLAALIERELTNFRPDYVSLNNLEIDAKPDRATASFRAATGGKYEGQGVGVTMPRYLVRLRLHLVKRDGRWRITEIHRFDPQINAEQEIELGAR